MGCGRAIGAFGAQTRNEEESMPCASLTTSDAVSAPKAPIALRGRVSTGPSPSLTRLDVAHGYAFAVSPRMWARGVPNAARPITGTGS
jgi:hypothetical protein